MDRPQVRNGSPGASYKLLPFRFTRFDGKTLLVNQGGQFLLLPNGEFERFVVGTLDTSGEAFLDLKAKHFLADGKTDLPQAFRK